MGQFFKAEAYNFALRMDNIRLELLNMMKKRRIIISVVSFVLFSIAVVSAKNLEVTLTNIPPETLEITLQDAIAIALRENLDIKIEKFQTQSRRAEIGIEEGAFDPEFNILLSEDFRKNQTSTELDGAEIGENRTKTASVSIGQSLKTGTTYEIKWILDKTGTNSIFVLESPYYATDLVFEIKQPLLEGLGKDIQEAKIAIARYTYEFSLMNLNNKTLITISIVEKLYWDLLYALDELEVLKLSLRLATTLRDESAARIKAGLLAPSELLQAEAEIAAREEELLNVEKKIRDVEDQLKVIMNFHAWDMELIPVDKPLVSETIPDVNAEIDEALSIRSDYLQAELERKSSRVLLNVAKNKTLPDLSLIASVGLNGLSSDFSDTFDDQFSNDYYSWKTGIMFNIPIGNREARSNLIKARSQERRAVEVLSKVKQTIIVELREAIRAIESSLKKINATIKTEELAKKRLDNENEKFKNGLSTAHDVLTFQESFAKALSNRKKSLIDYAKAVADFRLIRKVGKSAL